MMRHRAILVALVILNTIVLVAGIVTLATGVGTA